MTDTITLTGLVATPPRHLITAEGLPITSFRLASTQRRYDRSKSSWVDGETNWYTITAFRQLAINVAGSITKGDRIVATGRLRIRDWESQQRKGTSVEVEAEAIGHDLYWGSASFTRTVVTRGTSSNPDPTQDSAWAGATPAADAVAVPNAPATEQAESATTDGSVTPVETYSMVPHGSAADAELPF